MLAETYEWSFDGYSVEWVNNPLVLPSGSSSTGWQQWSYTFQPDDDVSQLTLGFGVADAYDQEVASYLLVDNLRLNDTVIEGFETGTGTGPTLGDPGNVLSMNTGFRGLAPTEGNAMLWMTSNDDWSSIPPGNFDFGLGQSPWSSSTDIFWAADGTAQVVATITVNPGDTLSFDWAFLTDETTDPIPDFAFLGATDDPHNPTWLHLETLAVYAGAPSAVPVPPALWLFGSGLMGMVMAAHRRG